MDHIINAISRLEHYCFANNYRGYDPYDALKSPLFRLPILRSNKTLRFASQQLVKRLPFNIRPLLAIPKGYNPVTLGLCIQAYSYLVSGCPSLSALRPEPCALSPEPCALSSEPCALSPAPCALPPAPCALRPAPLNRYSESIDQLITELKKLIPAGYKGACWGYDFPWEARYASIPALQPTVVATGIISNALFVCHTLTGNKEAGKLCISAADFVSNDLYKSREGDTFCFSYSPFDKQQVFNANMKGARILAQGYSLTKDEKLKTVASQAVKYVLNNQNDDGSWYYSKSGKGEWIDNYHTGYILDCLDEYIQCTGDISAKEPLEKGYNFYRNTFFEPGGQPKFYSGRSWPVDCTAGAQSILTLCRFGDTEMAWKVAEYMINYMQSPEGGFYFRKYKNYTEKTIFMRWSNAWMFAALAEMLFRISDL